MPDDDAFSPLLPKLTSQDWYLARFPFTKSIKNAFAGGCYAVLTQQIFSSPKAFLAGHIGICPREKMQES
ncbi:MAG: hypothetical protein IJW70_04445, partial [Clostridia bacterium]|nr:hypothetical protein [Clostridia bacterium]